MSAKGVYTFPDDSSIHAMWSENKPVSEITYHEPLGYVWTTDSITEDVRHKNVDIIDIIDIIKLNFLMKYLLIFSVDIFCSKKSFLD